jgi:excisionase family DNA binding protein
MPRSLASNGASNPARQLISTTKAAERLNVSPGTIRQFIADGKLKGYKIAGLRNLKVDANQVDALIITVDNS